MSITRSAVLESPRLAGRSGALRAHASQTALEGRRKPFCPPAGSLPVLLNQEWEQLRASSEAAAALLRWAAPTSRGALRDRGALDTLDTLDAIVEYVQDANRTVAERDEVLLHLLALCQEGDRLAGRVVLQVMLPKAIRLAQSVGRHPDWTQGLDEARATVVAALWVAIASYPLERRPGRVTANLALDTLAVAQRGHTGSSWQVHPVREEPCGDVLLLADPGHVDVGADDPTGPADAELCTLLAWGVRAGVLQLEEARLLARVYGLGTEDGPALATPAQVAATLGISWPVLRQRCHRLARRLGQAAIASGIGQASPGVGSVLRAA